MSVTFTFLCLAAATVAIGIYVPLLITRTHNDPVQRFSNKVLSYAYRVMRYVTLNDNQRPFPFTDFPLEMDPVEEEPRFK